MKRFPAAGGDLRRGDGIEPLARRFSVGVVAGAAVGATTPPGRRAPVRRDARTIRTTTVTWNAQLARLERRRIRCWQHQAPAGDLISEPRKPQRNSLAGQGVDQARDTCGCYSGYSEDTTADNVSSPRLRTRRGYSKDTQNRA